MVEERIRFVEGCVVLDGQIQREVIVQLSTLNGSATGAVFEEFFLLDDMF